MVAFSIHKNTDTVNLTKIQKAAAEICRGSLLTDGSQARLPHSIPVSVTRKEIDRGVDMESN